MRQSGVLLHITSLPSNGGIGTLGKAAYDFVDFIKDSGMTIWQMLPLGPTGYAESPYQSSSTFAGNQLVIDFEMLEADGLLPKGAYRPLDIAESVDFEAVKEGKDKNYLEAGDAYCMQLLNDAVKKVLVQARRDIIVQMSPDSGTLPTSIEGLEMTDEM